jgi:AsmA protein
MLWDRKVVAGKVDAKLDLQGTSLEGSKAASSATGTLAGTLRDGAFLGADLTSEVLKPIAAKLPIGGKVVQGGSTPLGKDLAFAFEIANGLAKLSKPIQAGDLSLTGGVRTDGTLEMPATLKLTPETVAKMTGGRAKTAGPIPVPFKLGGPAWHPTVSEVGVQQAVTEIAKGMAGGLLGGTSAESAVSGQRAKAESEAKAQQEAAKKRAEEEAKKGLQQLFGK